MHDVPARVREADPELLSGTTQWCSAGSTYELSEPERRLVRMNQ
jgi:hypothetical protein